MNADERGCFDALTERVLDAPGKTLLIGAL